MATEVLSRMLWLDRATSLTPLIAGRRAQAEAEFRMHPGVRQEVGAAGLFRLGSPVDHTLPVASLEEFIRVQEQLAFADPSVAWASAKLEWCGAAARPAPGGIGP